MSIQTQIDRLRQNISAAFAAVGQLGGTLPASEVSGNLASAIGTIPTNSSAKATVNCGFKPDYAIFIDPRSAEGAASGYVLSATAHFCYNPSKLTNFAVVAQVLNDDYRLISFDVEQTNTGFAVLAENIDYTGGYSNAANTTFKYYAAKYG